MKRYFDEFKTFAVKGNVLDLAVGVVIGAAFGKIIDSLVSYVIMPMLGIILGGVDFSKITFGIDSAQINVGMFLQALLNFIIVATALFVFIKIINRFKRDKPKIPVMESLPPEDIRLLTEIRDLLKNKS